MEQQTAGKVYFKEGNRTVADIKVEVDPGDVSHPCSTRQLENSSPDTIGPGSVLGPG